MTSTIKLRRGTAAQWATANPVLALGEPGWDSTNKTLKIGDGVTAWGSLVAVGGDASGSAAWGDLTGTLSDQADLQLALDGKQAAGSYAASSHTHAMSDARIFLQDERPVVSGPWMWWETDGGQVVDLVLNDGGA